MEQKLVAGSKNVGYMAAVIEMALSIKKARDCSHCTAVKELLAQDESAGCDDWLVFCDEVLEKELECRIYCLGGEKPRPTPPCNQM